MRAKEIQPKKLVVFDIDDTLVYTQTKVHVVKDGKVVNSLNSHDFTHYKLKSGEIIGLRGDLSTPNQKIMDFMKKFNRYAIPFNVVYGPNAKEGILTSELLNKEELLDAIKKAQ